MALTALLFVPVAMRYPERVYLQAEAGDSEDEAL